MTDISTYLNYGVLLTRYAVGDDPNVCGQVGFWQSAVNQLYAQMPFPGLFKPLKLNIWHMDHPEQDRRFANKQYCLADYDPNTPGAQTADGLTGGEMDLALFPDGWTLDYSGPFRPIPDSALYHARKAMAHEFGHWHQWQCRYGAADDVSKWIAQRWREMRPCQAANEYEDWAEVYRALFGTDECRGYYSDGKPVSVSGELKALLQCAYWLQGNLQNLKVTAFIPQTIGVMYCALIGTTYKWRFIGTDWRSQEWVPPTNGQPEYWKAI